MVITLDDGSTVTADEVLVATGRQPRTTGLGLETVGLEAGAWIDVDDTMLATGASGNADRPWLYAVGDANHRALLTHQGKYQARATGDLIAARALGRPVDTAAWGAHVATADHGAVPEVVFSEPECVSVGLTVAAAERAGRTVRVADVEIGSVSGAGILADDYAGHARLVVDAGAGTVIGATFVGQDVAELLQAATIAIVGEVPVDRLWHAVPAFPTMSEIWLRLLEALGRPGSPVTQAASATIPMTASRRRMTRARRPATARRPRDRPHRRAPLRRAPTDLPRECHASTRLGIEPCASASRTPRSAGSATGGPPSSDSPGDSSGARARSSAGTGSSSSPACRTGPIGRGGSCVGGCYLTGSNTRERVLEHEAVHKAQWQKYGMLFPLLYFIAGRNPLKNRFEIEAGLEAGGYLRVPRRRSA